MVERLRELILLGQLSPVQKVDPGKLRTCKKSTYRVLAHAPLHVTQKIGSLRNCTRFASYFVQFSTPKSFVKIELANFALDY